MMYLYYIDVYIYSDAGRVPPESTNIEYGQPGAFSAFTSLALKAQRWCIHESGPMKWRSLLKRVKLA